MKPSTTVRVRQVDRGEIAMSVFESASGVVEESVDALRSLSGAMTVKDDTSAFLNALQDHRTAAHQGSARRSPRPTRSLVGGTTTRRRRARRNNRRKK